MISLRYPGLGATIETLRAESFMGVDRRERVASMLVQRGNGIRNVGLRRASALVLVPAIMILADVAADRTALKFLLLPPLGALTYLLFVNPAGVEMNVQRVIVTPSVTALFAWTVANLLGYNAVSVGAVTAGTMAIMWLFGSPSIVPPLALALLTILLHDQVRGRVDYLISVFLFTVVIYCLHAVWLRLPLDRTKTRSESS